MLWRQLEVKANYRNKPESSIPDSAIVGVEQEFKDLHHPGESYAVTMQRELLQAESAGDHLIDAVAQGVQASDELASVLLQTSRGTLC